jgi:peptidyl-prolyl cis-trans isomerase SurA
MKRALQLAIAFLVLATAMPVFAGEVIDGVVATVNHQPILRSDWDASVRFEAFMQQKHLADVSEGDRVIALQHLIDRQLLKAQMGDTAYMQPKEDALEQDIAKVRAQVPNGKDDAAWQKVLASYGLTEDEMKEHLKVEFQTMNFIEVRLRPNVHIPEEDVEAYYHETLIPDLQKNGGSVVALTDVAPRIRELLTQQRMDEMLDVWLHNLRQQADIHSTVAVPGVNAPAETPSVSGAN